MSICLAISDADWALTKDVISLVISGLGVGVAACVGFYGLATWRRQNKGTSDHDLSRRLLIDLYRLRDGIGQVRDPVMLGTEGASDEVGEPLQNLNFMQSSYRNTVRAYQNRLSVVGEVCARLNTSLLESEVVWGGEVKKLFEAIFKLQRELVVNVHSYLVTSNPDADSARLEVYWKILEGRRDVLYESPLEGHDVFKSELDTALSKVEDYLKGKLIK